MKRVSSIKGVANLLLLALFAAAFVVTIPDFEAGAYVEGRCKFAGTNPTIDYRFYAVASIYQSAFNSGQSAWDSTAAPGYFRYSPSDPDPEINVYEFWDTAGPLAFIAGGCPSGTGQTWNNDEVNISFNDYRLADDTTTERKLTAIHELGHAYGLQHEAKSCGHKAVMANNSRWVMNNCDDPYAPYADDIAGVIFHY